MSEHHPRALIASAYPLALLLVLVPLTSVAITVSPLRLEEVTWRYGAFGLVMQSTTLPLLGVALFCAAAYLLGHHLALRIIGALALLVAAMLAGGLALFALDALRMRPMVQPDAMGQFGMKSLWAGLAAAMTSLALAWMGIGAWRAPLAADTPVLRRPGQPAPRDRPALIEDAARTRPHEL
jgi:hypothetical protein